MHPCDQVLGKHERKHVFDCVAVRFYQFLYRWRLIAVCPIGIVVNVFNYASDALYSKIAVNSVT